MPLCEVLIWCLTHVCWWQVRHTDPTGPREGTKRNRATGDAS